MKFLPPRPSKSSSKPTFGADRADRLNQRLKRASAERRTLARAEAAADSPINDYLKKKGEQVGRSIGRLQQKSRENNT